MEYQVHPYYIDRRANSVSLDGAWSFGFVPNTEEKPGLAAKTELTCQIPASGFKNLQDAGLYPDPYFSTNSTLYEGVGKRFYYYRRQFSLGDTSGKDVFLCFEGVGYSCRVWLNGELLCEHAGMFGGPICEVSEYVREGENELLVEVTPPAPDFERSREHDERALSEIVPWNIRNDISAANGVFTVFGIWRSVRIEVVDPYHLSRPYLYTESIADGKAILQLEVELADPQKKELECLLNGIGVGVHCNFTYQDGLDIRPTGKKLEIAVSLTERTTGNLAYFSREEFDVFDKNYTKSHPKWWECQFIEKTIEIDNPRLWNPTDLGSPELYDVTLELFDGDNRIDRLSFATGIRTIEYRRSAVHRFSTRWDDFKYVVNGHEFFLKGMNWMPGDFLYNTTDAEYRWLIELARDEHIQLLRIWSGGGMPEDDRFYDLCDELGILVMQDSFIANETTEHWDRQILQSQVCRTLYRIRNHPSLANHTGGNEHNPYALGNDAAMWVIARETEDLDPSRKFFRTTPDKGDAHIYQDMEPVWYRKIYCELPMIGEAGIHSFPNAKTLRQQISEEEYNRPLSNIFSDEFKVGNPELYHHFVEFIPERVPRMMARASMISNVRGISLPDLCEATQLAACEFYQVMINSMRENFPRNCGIMPWVFKRPWTVVGIQLVDGLGDPVAPYYYVKNAYAPLSVELALHELTYAPGETFQPEIRLINGGTCSYQGLTVSFELYSPKLELLRRESFSTDIAPHEEIQSFIASEVQLPEDKSEYFFFMRAVVSNGSGMLNQSFYWCKVLERFRDREKLATWRRRFCANLNFEEGPWLRPQIASLDGSVAVHKLFEAREMVCGERRVKLKLRIDNTGSMPLFPVKANVVESGTLSYATDNYFFLAAGESREIEVNVRITDNAVDALTLEVSAWNCNALTVRTNLN